MADQKFDGVVEAVRYADDGKIRLVRVYLRRGPTWSDKMLLTRQDFISMLKTGKRMMVGKRVPYMAGTFDVNAPVKVQGSNGQEYIYTSQPADNRDSLEGAPVF